MVNKHSQNTYKELEGGLPPLDESWWEAVLTEDEAYLSQPVQKNRLRFKRQPSLRRHALPLKRRP